MKYLTFMLADQFCGFELSCVRELLGYMNFTPAPGEHPAVAGYFDLRGRSVRVLDLRLRFGLPATRTDDTAMIIVDLAGAQIAAIVDKTVGVENLGTQAPFAASTRSPIDPQCILGTVAIREKPLILLNAARSMTTLPPLQKAA